MVKNALMTSAVAAMLMLGAASVSAQSTNTTGASSTGTGTGGTGGAQTTQTTPGAPNTGGGGQARDNILLLVGSALAVIGGATYLSRNLVTR